MTEPSGGTKAAGVLGINGDPGPFVTLDAGEIPSTGPSNVQADLDSITVTLLAHATRHAPSGADALATAAPVAGVGGGNTEGAATTLARSDHDHTIRESGGQDLTMGAVADGEFLVRSGTTIAGRFAPIYEFASRQTPLATTSATPTSYLLFTSSSVPAGTYEIKVTIGATGSAASTEVQVNLEIDGTPVGKGHQQTGVIDGAFVFSGVTPNPLGAGVHTVEFFVSKPAGTGTTTATFASIIMERKL